MEITTRENASIVIKWGGSVWLRDMRSAAKIGVREAITIYYWELAKALAFHWGSIQYRGNARKTIEHSPEGSPPFMQTGNLASSLKEVLGKRAGSTTDQEIGAVYTDVNYARTLELGGMGQSYSTRNLKYTSWILINPIRRAINIAPRPVWVPIFEMIVSRMTELIFDRARTMMKRTYV